MIPVVQTNTGGRGNCMAACLASILEISIDEAPDYRAIDAAGGSWINALNTWLSKHFNIVYFELESYYTQHVRPERWHLINYGDDAGGHSVVGIAGTPVWNPMGYFIGGYDRDKPEIHNYGVLVRLTDELRATWKPTWKECLCPRCIRGEG